MDPTLLSAAPRVTLQNKLLAAATPTDAGPAPMPFTGNPFTAAPVQLSASLGNPSAAPSQAVANVNELHRLQATGSGVSQIQNPWLRGVARIADAVGSFVAPNVARIIPGTTLHHQDDLAREQGIVANDQQTAQNEQQLQDEQAQAQQRAAAAARLDAQAKENAVFALTPEQAEAAGVPELAGQQMSARTYQKFVNAHEGHTTAQSIADNRDDTKRDTTQIQADAAGERNAATNQARQSIAEAANRTRVLVKGMGDATSTANSIRAHSGQVGGGSVSRTAADGKTYKVPADISKRASLADNVVENANAVDTLLQSHSDIVGRTGGRYTSVQQMIGSDDPAIAELGVRMHNIALASNGAHGVRAQGAIEQTENELFNHFKSGPNAIRAALGATKGSMQTFLDDEKSYESTGSRTKGKTSAPAAAPSSGPKVGDVVDGYKFKGGNPADQNNWGKP